MIRTFTNDLRKLIHAIEKTCGDDCEVEFIETPDRASTPDRATTTPLITCKAFTYAGDWKIEYVFQCKAGDVKIVSTRKEAA